MKKLMTLMMPLFLFVALFPAACAETSPLRNVILLTEYQQIGWGETFQLGVVDSDGNLWSYESNRRGEVPFGKEELLAWAESSDLLENVGSISRKTLSDIISLVETVPAQKVISRSYACDAGVQTSYAVRKDRNGSAEIVVLGMAGDDTFENTDPAAQSLYKSLLSLFSGITSFRGEKNIAPEGFRKMDLRDFCGYKGINLTRYTMTAYANDCETGATETTPALNIKELMRMTVTGKQNSMSTTGNTITYCFTDRKGNTVAVFEFYNGLLVRPDGMYSVK